jgi:hypothetical protein
MMAEAAEAVAVAIATEEGPLEKQQAGKERRIGEERGRQVGGDRMQDRLASIEGLGRLAAEQGQQAIDKATDI